MHAHPATATRDAIQFRQSGTPPAAPIAMPDQNLAVVDRVRFPRPSWRTRAGRLVTFGGAIGLTAYASQQVVALVPLADVGPLRWLAAVLFFITFGWISLAAMSAIAGVLLAGSVRRRQDAVTSLQRRTVLLAPICNEDPAHTFAALMAMGADLVELGAGPSFEIFVISDTTNPDIWVQETAAFHTLRQELQGGIAVWYRHRHEHSGKKAGNVRDFVTRWGGRYENMIVLDADSMLSASTLLSLAREMQAEPRCGILQSVPRLCRGTTLLARLQQFATAVYGPIVARGTSVWQGDDGNYWGHNAIIRVQAFAEAAGLPVLPGRKPFGGEILSHDFVEAALVRRAGWAVRMSPALEESWEEPPPSLLDLAARDRRWAQGNLQHLSIVSAKGLRWPSRAHLMIGVMSYLASPLWLMLLLVGLGLLAQTAMQGFDYFPEAHSLFPRWPTFDTQRMIMMTVTMSVLLVPKALGLLRAFGDRALRRGGIIRLCIGVLLETVLSALYAPILMLTQSRQIWEILRGKDSGWKQQQREGRTETWRTLARRHFVHTLVGLVVTAALLRYSPSLLAWMSPVLISLVLAVPLSRASGSRMLGRALRRCGLLLTPEEISLPKVFAISDDFRRRLKGELAGLTFAALLDDDERRQRHFSVIEAPPAPPSWLPDMGHLSVRYKIERADSVAEVLASLSAEEQLALLAHAADFEAFCALTHADCRIH